MCDSKLCLSTRWMTPDLEDCSPVVETIPDLDHVQVIAGNVLLSNIGIIIAPSNPHHSSYILYYISIYLQIYKFTSCIIYLQTTLWRWWR